VLIWLHIGNHETNLGNVVLGVINAL